MQRSDLGPRAMRHELLEPAAVRLGPLRVPLGVQGLGADVADQPVAREVVAGGLAERRLGQVDAHVLGKRLDDAEEVEQDPAPRLLGEDPAGGLGA